LRPRVIKKVIRDEESESDEKDSLDSFVVDDDEDEEFSY
jgi:hypothetical protein